MLENSSYPLGKVTWLTVEDCTSPAAIEVFEMEKGTSLPSTFRIQLVP